MSSIAISAGAFVLAFGGALLAALLGARLPQHHLSEQNKEIVRLAMALVGTLAGMALGLLIGSAKSYYDTQTNELTGLGERSPFGPPPSALRTRSERRARIIAIGNRADFSGDLAK